jgi:hypothetical protein
VADVELSYADILAALANNADWAIDAPEVRQSVISALGGYGQLSVVDGSTPQALDGSVQKLLGFTDALPADPNSNVVPNVTNQHMTVAVEGVYQAHLSVQTTLSGTVGAAELGVAVDGVPTVVRMKRELAAPKLGEHCSGLITVSTGQAVSAYVKLLSGTGNITLEDGTLWIKRAG